MLTILPQVFNWQRLSDESATVYAADLSPAQLAGQADVSFAVDFSRLSPHHLVGARAYAEAGFTAAATLRLTLSAASVRDRVFVDFSDLADLSQYPPAGVAARRAQSPPAEEAAEGSLWSAVFGESTALAAAITAGVVAATMLFAWAVWGV